MSLFYPVYGTRSTGTYASITSSNGRGPSPDIFRGVNFANQFPDAPFSAFEDFRNGVAHGTITLNSGTVTEGAGGNGELVLTSTTTADQGPTVQYKGHGLTPAAGQTICFETRLKVGGSGTPGNWVMGLCQVSTAPIGAGALADLDDYAYFSAIQELAVDFSIEDGTADSLSSITTLVDDTYVKLGFRCVVGKSIEVYINGVKYASNDLVASAFADGFVCPTFAVESEATTAPTMTVDWYAVGVVDGMSV